MESNNSFNVDLAVGGRIKIDSPVVTTRVGVLDAGARSLLAY